MTEVSDLQLLVDPAARRAVRDEMHAYAKSLADPPPEGFLWEYREGDDGSGSLVIGPDGKQICTVHPASRWRRAVGRWERVNDDQRPEGVGNGR